MPPRVGFTLSNTEAFRDAILPLVEEGLVDAIEREIDHTFLGGLEESVEPRWATALAEAYAADDALYGHGVWFSLLSAGWQARQDAWLERLAAECARLPHRHVSEHFGYYSAGPFYRYTMMPVPYCPAAVELGVERMRLIGDAVGAPIGLENAGTVLSRRDASEQAAFVRDLVVGAGGWLLLDVHNVWVQAQNTGLDPRAMIDAMPLAHVRELHVSGGSTAVTRAGETVHLDSHDGPVPRGAKDLLLYALPRCPAAEVVIVERRDGIWEDAAGAATYRDDFREIHRLIQEAA